MLQRKKETKEMISIVLRLIKVEWLVRSSSLPWVALNLSTEKEAKAILERCLITSDKSHLAACIGVG